MFIITKASYLVSDRIILRKSVRILSDNILLHHYDKFLIKMPIKFNFGFPTELSSGLLQNSVYYSDKTLAWIKTKPM